MQSKAEQLCAHVALILTQAGIALAVYRDRDDAFSREESPAILVEMIDEETKPVSTGGIGGGVTGGRDQDTLRFAVTVCVRGANWQTEADQIRVKAHAALAMNAALRTMAASVRRDRCEWRPASTDQPFGYAAQIYAAKYLTSALALDAAI